MAGTTLKDILDPKFQIKQAKYENARGAIVAAYTVASKFPGTYANIEDYFKVVDQIKERYHKDLDSTLKLLDD